MNWAEWLLLVILITALAGYAFWPLPGTWSW